MKIKNICVLWLLAIFIAACGGSNVQAVSPTPVSTDGFQIDEVTTIPVLAGNATDGVVFVHNDGNSTIRDIKYTLADSSVVNDNIVDQQGFTLFANSAAKCATLGPKSSCALKFTTPSLSLAQQSSAVLIASYKAANGEVKNFSQLLNYAFYDINAVNGVNLSASANIDRASTSRYLTSYVVVGNKSPYIIYDNVRLQISNPGMVSLQQGFINGQQVTSGQLIPVEFKISPYVEDVSATVIPTFNLNATNQKALNLGISSSGGTLFLNYSSVEQAGYHFGLVPLLSDNDSITVYITSFAATNWQNLSLSLGDNLLITDNTCQIGNNNKTYCSYRVTTNSSHSGNSKITSQVSGSIVDVQTVYYMTSQSQASDSTIINSQSVYNVTLNNGVPSNSISFVFYNLSSESVYDLAFTPKSSGGSYLEIIDSDCPRAPNTFSPYSSCIVNARIIPASTTDSGIVYFNVSSKNSRQEEFNVQSSIIGYSVLLTMPILVFTTPDNSEANLQIAGNGIDYKDATFTVYNPNSSSININSISLNSDKNAGLDIANSTCGQSLAAMASCKIVVKYGPILLESSVTGSATLRVSYGSNQVLIGKINYVGYSSFDSYLDITNVTTVGFVSGSGASDAPYLARACLTKTPSITVTYRNMSSTYAMNQLSFNIANGSLSPYLTIDDARTTCGYGAKLVNLSPLQECSLVFIPDTSMMTTSSAYSLNLVFPSATWNTRAGFVEQNNFSYNGINGIFSQYLQPAINSSLTPLNGISLQRKLTQMVANAESCTNIQTTISSLQPFGVLGLPTIVSGNCVAKNDGSVDCTNSAQSIYNEINYIIPNDLLLPVNMFFHFEAKPNTERLFFNPVSLIFKVES